MIARTDLLYTWYQRFKNADEFESRAHKPMYLHEKNEFAEVSKNLGTNLKIILLDHQNNCVGNSSMMSNSTKSFDILVTNSSVQHHYFDGPTELFLDPYLNF